MARGKWKLNMINLGAGGNTYVALIDFNSKNAVLVYNAAHHRVVRSIAEKNLTKSFGISKSRIEKKYEQGGPLEIKGDLWGADVMAGVEELEYLDEIHRYRAHRYREITEKVLREGLAVLAGLSHKLVPRDSRILFGPPGARSAFPFKKCLERFIKIQGSIPKRRCTSIPAKITTPTKSKAKPIPRRRL